MKRAVLISAAALILGVPLYFYATRQTSTFGSAIDRYKMAVVLAMQNMTNASREAAYSLDHASPDDTRDLSRAGELLLERHRTELERLREAVETVRREGAETICLSPEKLAGLEHHGTRMKVRSDLTVFERNLALLLAQADRRINSADSTLRTAREKLLVAVLSRNPKEMSAEIAAARLQFEACQNAITSLTGVNLSIPPTVQPILPGRIQVATKGLQTRSVPCCHSEFRCSLFET